MQPKINWHNESNEIVEIYLAAQGNVLNLFGFVEWLMKQRQRNENISAEAQQPTNQLIQFQQFFNKTNFFVLIEKNCGLNVDCGVAERLVPPP